MNIAFSVLINVILALGFAAAGRAQSIEIVHDFAATGTGSLAGLIEGSDGFLYGTTQSGGVFGHGTVYRIDRTGTADTLHHFHCGSGCQPRAGLIQLSGGFLYGTTELGGANNQGTIFKILPDGTGFSVIKTFKCDGITGCFPKGSLIQLSDGFLYGTTNATGGSIRFGTVFKLMPDGTGFSVIKYFEGCGSTIPNTSGCHPNAGLTQLSDGFLYSTAETGGVFNNGTVFKLMPDGTGFSVIKTFQCGVASNGCAPRAGLIQLSDGFLYGTTQLGGANNGGTVFKLLPDGTGFSVIKSFQCGTAANGCQPQHAGLIPSSGGFLYGTTQSGGASSQGTVFKLMPDGTGFSVIKTFQCAIAANGCHPWAGVIQLSDGFLYGTTQLGGVNNQGTVFKIDANGNNFSLLRSFGCDPNNGCQPWAGVIQLSDGFLYGTTQFGGVNNAGTIFKVLPDGTGFSVIKTFQCGAIATNGCNPRAGLIQLNDGFLYGTTELGGASNHGTIFKVLPDGTGFSVVYPFLCFINNGCRPFAGLIQLSDGFLYGTTISGGNNNNGTIFKIKPDGTGFSVIKFLACSTTGCSPIAGLIQLSDGFLYGTTNSGGPSGGGTVFKILPDGAGFSVIKTFQCGIAANGCQPDAGLTQSSDGFLYGTTELGGANNQGTIFKVLPDGTGFNVIKSFQCGVAANGCQPFAGLIPLSDGFLYGTTFAGGADSQGTVFKILTDGSDFNIVDSFACDGDNGCNPRAGLIQASDGHLYGTTQAGGITGAGTIFRVPLAPTSQAISVTQSSPASAVYNTLFNVAATGGASGNPVVIAASGACSGGGNNTAIVTMTSGTGTCTVTFNQAGNATHSAAPTVTQTTSALKATPTITWNNPADITFGTPLSSTQLNATANAVGTFVYTPAAGTVPNAGNGQTLSVLFTPVVTADYNNATANVLINVLADTTPPDTTIASAPPTVTNGTSATFAFTANEAGSTFSCSLDAAVFAACTSSTTYHGLASGAHIFQVTATDAANNTDPTAAIHNWTINAAAPVANNQSVTTNQDTPLLITLSGGDTDSSSLSFSILSNLTNGSLGSLTAPACVPSGSGSTCTALVTYTPNVNFNGSDSFSYKANDGLNDSNVATVRITVNAVNAAPVATNDTYVTDEDTPLVVASPGVLGNDNDPDDGSTTLTATLVSGPSNAISFVLNSDGSFSYTPNGNFNGSDSFSYKAKDTDNAESNLATVTITVTAINDIPVAQNDNYNGNEDTALAIAAPGVLGNDNDAADGSTTLTAVLVNSPSNGSLTLNPDGSFNYTPNGNFNGNDSFTYKAKDSANVESNVATVTIAINAINDAPVANNDSYSTNEDTQLVMPAPAVLFNDTDIDTPTLTVSLVTHSLSGSVILNGDGSFTYTPNPNFNGNDSFTYKAADGTHDSNVAMVNITVNAVNDVPAANGQSVTTNENTPVIITLSGNDSDSGSVTFGSVGRPSNGTLGPVSAPACSPGSGATSCTATVSYSPSSGFNGADSFTFKVNDGQIDSNTATINITVNPVSVTPDTTIAAAPAASTNSRSASFSFVSDIAGSAFECRLDSAPFTTCNSPTNYTSLAPGKHSFHVRAKVGATVDPSPATHAWTVDLSAPNTTITSGPPATTNSPNANFTFTAAAEFGSTFACRLDGAAFTACISPVSYSSLSSGVHLFVVRATDAAGNTDLTPAFRLWLIDRPNTTITSGPATVTTSRSARFRFTSTEPASSFECSLDNGAFQSCNSPRDYSGLARGTHSFRVRAIDAAGNTEPTPANFSWRIQ